MPIVGIGASAGGVEALRSFFEVMPPDSGLGFIVALHTAPDRKSLLPDILARWTAMPVAEAEDGDFVQPNHVLIVPGGAVASLTDGHIRLRHARVSGARELTPIDVLLDSLATTHGEAAIGVILSGTGHDGALGLKAIKTFGGLTLAQGVDSTAPQHSGMPDSAVAAGGVDLLVPVQHMAEHILRMRAAKSVLDETAATFEPLATRARLTICDILRERLGHDFGGYKEQTFMRRVQRRMQVLKLTDFDEFIGRLRADRDQVVLLFRDLLISVTSFFRDSEAFAVLEREVVPLLFKDKHEGDALRVWVPACATGEEAYSVAMLLREHMDKLAERPKVQIFASDIDETAIATARAGRYPASLLDGMSQQRRDRFFVRDDGIYSIADEVRRLCTFSAHSLIRDPPFSRVDLVSCRNLLIYLDVELQSKVIPIFHYSLVPGGILMLGTSESVPRQEALFAPLDRSQRLFLRKDGPSEMPRLSYSATDGKPSGRLAVESKISAKTRWQRAVNLATRRVLERFSSAFVVVSVDGEVVHYSSHVGQFVEPPFGAPTANLFEMARRGWGRDLRAALQRCKESGRPAELERPGVAADGEPGPIVKLTVEALPPGEGGEQFYLVVFAEQPAPSRAGSGPSSTALRDESAIAHLEAESTDLREQLESITEEHATALEELRSSNEELQSVNEELQSTNEELETSKEEIQSANEELSTVNAELSAKIDQLDHSNSDLRNLLGSLKVATVFLDPLLRIRSFTPAITETFSLIDSDVGRPITDIASRLDYADLRADVKQVLTTLEPLERKVRRTDGKAHYLLRILPYRTPDGTVNGSLFTLVDVTNLVQAEEHQRLLVDELNHRVKNMLTVVTSLATQTMRRVEKLEDFGRIFLGRLQALTAAYALLSRENWARVRLRDVVTEELTAFMADQNANVHLDGPDVSLEPRAALALGMAVHELTTNAVKYGALATQDGQVDVAWSVEGEGSGATLMLRWTERNGPPVTRPERRGFGLTLIERGLAHDLGGDVQVTFAPEGVRAVLRAPLNSPAPTGSEDGALE